VFFNVIVHIANLLKCNFFTTVQQLCSTAAHVDDNITGFQYQRSHIA